MGFVRKGFHHENSRMCNQKYISARVTFFETLLVCFNGEQREQDIGMKGRKEGKTKRER
jgi:hypothetical protein